MKLMLNIFLVILAPLLSYLLGSINGSLVLGRFKKIDIRSAGSGNAGGTNAFRTQGFKFALAVIIIDIGKALLAVFLAKTYLPNFIEQAELVVCLCAIAVVVGHCYPVWHGFKGGKGIATYAGVVLALVPEHFLLIFLIIISILILTGYVSLASMLTALTVPIIYANAQIDYFGQALFWTLLFLSLFVIFTHRSNIRKLLSGTENRFEKIRLVHRLFQRD